MNFGQWEGKTYGELAGDPQFEDWINHHFTSEPPGVESFPIFTKRIEEGWKKFRIAYKRKGSKWRLSLMGE